jgi:hypothetical protein
MPSRPVLAICVMFINALFCTLLAEVVPVDELKLGLAWCGVFPTLNISTRNAIFHLSVMENAFWMLTSPLISPGPRKTFWPQLPKAVAEGAANEEGSYHCKTVPSSPVVSSCGRYKQRFVQRRAWPMYNAPVTEFQITAQANRNLQGLHAVRAENFSDGGRSAQRLSARNQPELSHVVSVGRLKSWLDGNGKSPNEHAMKSRLRGLVS